MGNYGQIKGKLRAARVGSNFVFSSAQRLRFQRQRDKRNGHKND